MQWSFSLNNFGVRLSLQSWTWCLRCCSVVVSSKGTHKVEHNCTHKKSKLTKCPKFKWNTVSVSFSACRCNSIVFSSKVGRENKTESGDSSVHGICGCGLLARCCQPAVAGGVIYADLGVSLTLTWPCRLCLVRVLLCVSHCYKLSPFQAHWGRWHCTRFLRPVCLFTAHMGGGSSPLSCGVSSLCHSHKLSRSWLLGACPRSSQSLSGLPSLFLYSSGKDSLPPIFGTQCGPLSFPCVFIVLIAYYSVSLFSLGGGWSVQGAMLLWPRVVCGSTAYH
jgi:hypothetical protein